MAKIRKIVVPTDFSESSKKVVAHAAAMASSHDAELLLLHAIPPTVYPTYRVSQNRGFPNMTEQMESSAKAQLEDFRKQLGTDLKARLFVRTGEPFREVAKLVDEEKADLIAIATHGHTGIKHAILGSTAEKIVRSACVPVLTIRQDEQDPAVTPLNLRRILVPTDFSDLSLRAFTFAKDLLATNTKAEIIFAHVFEPPTYPSGPFGVMTIDMGQVEVDLREQARESMEALVTEQRGSWENLRGEISEGMPDQALCELVDETQADLVAIATHGYTGFKHMFLGSVTEKVVRRAHCPVITVHAGD